MAERNTLARPYAQAIFDLAIADNILLAWANGLDLLAQIILDANAKVLINNQTIRYSQKAKFVFAIISSQQANLSPDLPITQINNLLIILATNVRLNLLPEIAAMYRQFMQVVQQQHTIKINAVQPLTTNSQEKLLAHLNKKFQHNITLEFVADASLLAGVKLQEQDDVTDYSLQGQLQELHKVLRG